MREIHTGLRRPRMRKQDESEGGGGKERLQGRRGGDGRSLVEVVEVEEEVMGSKLMFDVDARRAMRDERRETSRRKHRPVEGGWMGWRAHH
jgi:hypothetical protein